MVGTPVTIITGFLGSGKTTLILNLIPQLPSDYKLALLKNEFGDVAVDSQLAASSSISGVRELLNGCICCNLVGQLSEALFQLRDTVPDLSRIVIETSGSAFPATLAMEVNRISREQPGSFSLDGVVSVIDVENWKGYEDTSYTARLQAQYTDLVVFNKWEVAGEDAFDRALDRLGDLDVQVAWVKSRKGRVEKDVVLGIDGAMVLKDSTFSTSTTPHSHDHDHDHNHDHDHQDDHQDEVEVLSLTLHPPPTTSINNKNNNSTTTGMKLDEFEDLLLSAPKDEVYRIKGLVASAHPPPDSAGRRRASITPHDRVGVYVLNWAFGRWTYTQLPAEPGREALGGACARLTFVLARGEAARWKGKLEGSDSILLEEGEEDEGRDHDVGGGVKGVLEVKRL